MVCNSVTVQTHQAGPLQRRAWPANWQGAIQSCASVYMDAMGSVSVKQVACCNVPARRGLVQGCADPGAAGS